jgi:hypothetical protein
MLTIISLMQLCMFDVIKVYIFQFDLNRMLNALCSIKSRRKNKDWLARVERHVYPRTAVSVS